MVKFRGQIYGNCDICHLKCYIGGECPVLFTGGLLRSVEGSGLNWSMSSQTNYRLLIVKAG